eukprot:gene9054-1151_t
MNRSQQKEKTEEDKSDGVNIQVVVRCRPPNQKELHKEICIKTSSSNKEVLVNSKSTGRTISKPFNYDYVFGPNSSQKEVFDDAIKPLVEEVLAGYNCTVFAYGQTSTGKTFTMEGKRNPENNQIIKNEEGVIPRSVAHIFGYLKKNNGIDFNIRLSCLELYNEELQDLLASNDEKKQLRLFDQSGGGTIVNGLEEVVVKTIDDLNSFLELASKRRHIAETQLNHSSSRSHFITTLTIHLKEPTLDGEGLVKTGKLYLVDLAGSENIARSGALKKRAQEAGMINQSLLTLGRVITALTERKSHIPYRESKLTRLLQDSLGGKTKTCIIATVSPSVSCYDESMSTLEYARSAKSIKNKPQQNMKTPKNHLITDMTHEIDQLKLELTAARLKNGIYISEETFIKNNEKLEMQDRMIESLTDENELKKKVLEELTHDYESAVSKLEEGKKELVESKKLLELKEITLNEREKEVQSLKDIVEMKKYIISESQKSESQLHSEASNVLINLKTCLNDIDEYNLKLQKNLSLISRNEKLNSNYHQSLNKKGTSMKQDIQTFSNIYQSSVSNMIDSISKYKEGKVKELKEMKEELFKIQSSFESTNKEITQTMNSRIVSNKSNTIALSSEQLENSKIIRNSLENISENINEIISQLNSKLDGHFIDIENVQKSFEISMKNNLEIVNHFSILNSNLLNELENKMISTGIQQTNDYLKHQDGLMKNEELHNERLENVKNEILGNFEMIISNALNKEKEEFSNTIKEMKDSFTGSIQTIKESNRDNLLLTSKLKEESNSFNSNYLRQQDEFSKKNDENLKHFEQSLNNDKTKVKEFSLVFSTGQSDIQEKLTNFGDKMQEKIKQEMNEMSTFKTINERIQTENVEKISIQLENVSSKMENENKKSDEFLKKFSDHSTRDENRVHSLIKRVQSHIDQNVNDSKCLFDLLEKNEMNNETTKKDIEIPNEFTRLKEESILENEFKSTREINEPKVEEEMEQEEQEEKLDTSDRSVEKESNDEPVVIPKIVKSKASLTSNSSMNKRRRTKNEPLKDKVVNLKRQSDVGTYQQHKKKRI